MRILLLGKNGQVGWELQRTLVTLGEVYATDYPEIDLGDVLGIRSLVRAVKPDVIVNAAAYTDVDKAEKEVSQAYAINATAPGVLAEEALELGAGLVHYSTDYIFDGKKSLPYIEDDKPNPINTYGKSKLKGECAIQNVGGEYLILRTSSVYSLRRGCFVTKVLGWAREQRTVRVVSDQVSSPTWCRVLAEVTAHLLMGIQDDPVAWFGEHKGVYHMAGNGNTSRFDWARAIIHYDPHQDEQISEVVLPVRTAEFPTPAERPLYTALNCERFCSEFGLVIPSWEETLQLAMVDKARF